MTREQFRQKFTAQYSWLFHHNKALLDKYLPKTRKVYCFADCVRIAKQYDSRTSWHLKHQSSYSAARRNGWLNECCLHMESNYWTKDECLRMAKQYTHSSAWKRGHPSSHSAACRNGWYGECKKHFKSLSRPANKQQCARSALRYKTRGEWRRYDKYYYQMAVVYKWLDEMTNHMGYSLRERMVVCIETGQIFQTAKDASLFLKLRKEAVSKAIRRGNASGGYRWAYCDKNGKIIK